MRLAQAIETLIDSENKEISELARAFHELFIRPSVGFRQRQHEARISVLPQMTTQCHTR
jgi:hypothetical protein